MAVLSAGDQISLCKKDGTFAKAKVDTVYMNHGLIRQEVDIGVAGDIVQLTGITEAQIGETIADAEQPEALPVIEVEAPTLHIYWGRTARHLRAKRVNLTPLARSLNG